MLNLHKKLQIIFLIIKKLQFKLNFMQIFKQPHYFSIIKTFVSPWETLAN